MKQILYLRYVNHHFIQEIGRDTKTNAGCVENHNIPINKKSESKCNKKTYLSSMIRYYMQFRALYEGKDSICAVLNFHN